MPIDTRKALYSNSRSQASREKRRGVRMIPDHSVVRLVRLNRSTTIWTMSLHSVMAPMPSRRNAVSEFRQGWGDAEPLHPPMSPHASFLPMGPTTLYPITSRTVRRCCWVRGCSYMSVFMAGKTYVGVVGARARNRDVCGVFYGVREEALQISVFAHREVIAQSIGDLG